MYTSPDVNEVAKLLLDKYKILTNYLDFKSDYIMSGGGLETNRFQDSQIADWTLGQ